MPPRNAWLRQAIPLHGQLIPCIEYNGRIVPPFNLAQFHPKLSLLWAIRVLHPCRQLMSVGHGWVKAREDWRSLHLMDLRLIAGGGEGQSETARAGPASARPETSSLSEGCRSGPKSSGVRRPDLRPAGTARGRW